MKKNYIFMTIKYLNNIHNLDNYYSIVKNVSFSIHLTKNDSNYVSLDFTDKNSRDYILNEIWSEMSKHTEFLDIDERLILYNETKKYNL